VLEGPPKGGPFLFPDPKHALRPAAPETLLDRKDKQASNLACLWATDGKNKVVFI
tara:strand:- start:22 stop:186 length:165 start_codon:yes stop_codon:yes gene_type:complete